MLPARLPGSANGVTNSTFDGTKLAEQIAFGRVRTFGPQVPPEESFRLSVITQGQVNRSTRAGSGAGGGGPPHRTHLGHAVVVHEHESLPYFAQRIHEVQTQLALAHCVRMPCREPRRAAVSHRKIYKRRGDGAEVYLAVTVAWHARRL